MAQYILCSKDKSDKLTDMIHALNATHTFKIIHTLEYTFIEGDFIVFAGDLDAIGENIIISREIFKSITLNNHAFKGVQGAFLLNSDTIYFTKSYAKRMMFILNQQGMYFYGHALIEAIKDYKNYKTWQKAYPLPLDEVCHKRIHTFAKKHMTKHSVNRKKLLVLHASQRETSNTLMLWDLVQENLNGFNINVTHIENGDIIDCKGCEYTTCLHYAEDKSCFYGGIMTKEILPAVEWSDIIVWVCPNYNDAVSAMHTALINRLTVLYRRISFSDKQMYGIIVSANSGADIVSGQLISALNLNKGFMLPPYAMLCEIANDPGSILKVEGIHKRAKAFAETIMNNATM